MLPLPDLLVNDLITERLSKFSSNVSDITTIFGFLCNDKKADIYQKVQQETL